MPSNVLPSTAAPERIDTEAANLALYRRTLDLLGRKLIEDEGTIGVGFPYVTAKDGSWRTMSSSLSAGYRGEEWSHGNWFCGFWVGLLLGAHLHTGDARFLDLAVDRMALVAGRAADGNTHDIGFIFLASAIPLHRITGEARWRDVALQAADQLRRRLVTTRAGAYISSWGPMSDPRGRASSAIDTMANIPLLYWAAEETGDASFRLAGEAHARSTLRTFVRDDLTLYHAVEYDTVSGERRRGYTYQGLSDSSSWSRGTGWAVYGLAATAAATGGPHFLAEAEALAGKWLDQLGNGIVPPWDFGDASPVAPEDSSASAIMASALLAVAEIHPDPEAAARWTVEANRLLTGLCTHYLATDPAHRGLLRHGCYSKPHNIGTDAAVMFGDYFFVEALARILMPGNLSPRLAAVPLD